MKRIAIISAIIFCAVQLSCIAAEEQQNTPSSTNVENEMDDFIQYYRSNKSQTRDDVYISPNDLLQNDLIVPQSIPTGSGHKNADIAKNQSRVNESVKGTNNIQTEVKKDSHDVQTGVENKQQHTSIYNPHNLWPESQPLYQGNNPNAQNQNIQAGTQPAYVLTPTGTQPAYVLTPTVVYTSGGQSN